MIFKGSTWEDKLELAPDTVEEMLRSNVPMAKLGSINDIMGYIRWFLSDANSYATGCKFTIDGGQTI